MNNKEKIMITVSKKVKEYSKQKGAKKGLPLATYITSLLTEQMENEMNYQAKMAKIAEFGMEARVRVGEKKTYCFELAREGQVLFSFESKDFEEGIDTLYNRALFELGPFDRARFLTG